MSICNSINIYIYNIIYTYERLPCSPDKLLVLRINKIEKNNDKHETLWKHMKKKTKLKSAKSQKRKSKINGKQENNKIQKANKKGKNANGQVIVFPKSLSFLNFHVFPIYFVFFVNFQDVFFFDFSFVFLFFYWDIKRANNWEHGTTINTWNITEELNWICMNQI